MLRIFRFSALLMALAGTAGFTGPGFSEEASPSLLQWKKQAQQGDVSAALRLARAYQQQANALPEGDAPKRRELLQAAADMESFALRQLQARITTQNDAEAMRQLGLMHLYGQGVAQDSAAAKGLLEQAVAGDNIAAKVTLAKSVLNRSITGIGDAAALAWLRDAAAAGKADAWHLLGDAYAGVYSGQPVQHELAADAYRHAAEAGHKEAKRQLAFYYAAGMGGVPRDAKRAEQLLREAAQAGDVRAKRLLLLL